MHHACTPLALGTYYPQASLIRILSASPSWQCTGFEYYSQQARRSEKSENDSGKNTLFPRYLQKGTRLYRPERALNVLSVNVTQQSGV